MRARILEADDAGDDVTTAGGNAIDSEWSAAN